ncbi:MAG TPA: hypothetical protein VED24_02995 [Candidatus Acidoferrum sp.]|nr:hypothetical protein [Candidatus Acidoferrum sp.]
MRLYLDLVTAHSTILFAGPQEAGIIRVVKSRVIHSPQAPENAN